MVTENLKSVADTWETLAQIDPLWAVLSEPEKRGRRWDVAEFLETGEAEIRRLLADIDELGGLPAAQAALDFGCGVGRLSIPLSMRFDRVIGIDISPSMVENARRLARARPNVEFIVNPRDDLARLPDAAFDLVYSNIVLQHMDPALAAGYIAEFYRVARPGGFVVFQIPSHLTEEWLPHGNDGTRLPDGAHRARISFDAPEQVHAGECLRIHARVRNESPVEWLQDLTHQINLGNHWHDAHGSEIRHDDGRARMPSRLVPGEECNVIVDVVAPDSPGPHELELDIVQEGVNWFADRGSPTARRQVMVVAAEPHPSTSSDDAPADYPTFIMRGIPRHEVERLIAGYGGELLACDPHETEWVSYRYITRRST
ncbi:class I SAM-dependent methyltransferase [Lysobacter arvi]|uniref:Class I SAM-dependent methyltransferase n=1 Tax=Lysobacter arvi TaxID=3038776 RepID=A0ABU1CCH7_9GAMM|nr:class I SAM-dependent methyltransferase [Lysobacter arvi]MDR0182896.1 class I SAM-dependent methyltransferase [Lysobacter arvi]